jgi:anthranilate synthase component 1
MRKRQLLRMVKEANGDMLTPVSVYLSYVGDERGFLLESKEQGKGRYSFIGKADTVVSCQQQGVYINRELYYGDDLFDSMQKILDGFELQGDARFPFEGGLVGSMGYDAVRFIEKLPESNPDEINIPIAEFMLCREFIVFDHYHNRIYFVVLHEEEATEEAKLRIEKMEQELSEPSVLTKSGPYTNQVLNSSIEVESFKEKVERVREYVMEGDTFQTVLSRRYNVKTDKPPFEIYRSLRNINPSPYLFYLNFVDYQILGSSPEMLVEKRGQKVQTCPIAGTRKRGANLEEDLALAQDLRTDEKEIAEHMMLVDLGRNDMGKIAQTDSVEVNRLMEVHNFSHVMHLVSFVDGLAKPEKSATEIFSAFFPAGTLSGAPKIRAMQIIDELEPIARSFYGGSVGYFSFNGDLDMCITIRSMAVKNQIAYLQAGAGIVLDSDPQKEFEETENKLGAALKALD